MSIKDIKPSITRLNPITDPRGRLDVINIEDICTFSCKRIYCLNWKEQSDPRGFHGHKELEQIVFCQLGSVRIVLENLRQEQFEFTLKEANHALHIPKGYWREIYPQNKNTILMVIASEKYDESDYLRTKESFLEYAKLSLA